MIVDVSYGATANKEFVQKWWRETGKDDPKAAIGIMANATYVPCINIAFWLGEEENWSEYFKKSVDSLIKFYGYTEIINKPEGCPW